MINIRKQFAGSGYLITDSPNDTTNVVCGRGHLYADGDSLVASLANDGTKAERRALMKLGEVVADCGDEQGHEVSIRFPLSNLRAIAQILRPRQAELARAA
jgi:hypothetical protein